MLLPPAGGGRQVLREPCVVVGLPVVAGAAFLEEQPARFPQLGEDRAERIQALLDGGILPRYPAEILGCVRVLGGRGAVAAEADESDRMPRMPSRSADWRRNWRL